MFCWTYHPAEVRTWSSQTVGCSEGVHHVSTYGDRSLITTAVTIGHMVYSVSSDSVNIFNTVALRWEKLPLVTTRRRGERPPEVPHVCPSSAVLIENIVYLWGQWPQFPPDNRLYAFDTDAHRWLKTEEVSGSVPEARSGHSACVLGKVMYVHGGCTEVDANNDTYKLDTTTMVWSLINTRGATPPVSYQHSATVIGTKMFVFGGWANTYTEFGTNVYEYIGCRKPQVEDYNNIRVFDTETNCWLSITPPTQLFQEDSDHSAFSYDGELYVFRYRKTFNGLWKFNATTLSWKKVELKGGDPFMMQGSCCMVGDRVFLFCRDLYILDLSPSLKTLSKLAVIQYGLEQSELPHNIRWELASVRKWQRADRWELVAGGQWQKVGTGSHA